MTLDLPLDRDYRGSIVELLERDQQLSTITTAIQAAGLREGRLIVLQGPAGVGKTALLTRAAACARTAGFVVLQARAVELEHDLPFGVVRELLARVAAEHQLEGAAALARPALGLAAPPPASGDPLPAALHGLHAVCAQLTERRPLALVVDDAHWADVASLRFLAHLARRLGDLPIVLVVGTRSHEPGAPQELLDALVHDCGGEDLRPLALSPQGTSELLRERLPGAGDELCAACHVASGGNPFLVEELARELAASDGPARAADVAGIAPRTVARSVLLRLGRLSADAQVVARAAALFPDGAPFRHVAALAGIDESAVVAAADELVAAGVLAAQQALTFLHPLMRTAVYDDLAPASRAQGHARAAELLIGEEAAPEAIAIHLLATHPGASATRVDLLRRAAEHALGLGASETAVRYLRRALEEPPPAPARPQLLQELGRAALLAGDAQATEYLRGAVAAAEPGRARAAMAVDLAQALAFESLLEEAVEMIDLAIADVEDDDPDLALGYHAHALWMEWPVAELRQGFEERLDRLPADIAGDTIAEQRILCYRAFQACVALEHHDHVAELALRAVGDGRLPSLGMDAGGPVSYATDSLAACDRLDEARRANALVLEACSAAGELVVLPLGHGDASKYAVQAGDSEEAVAHALAARDAAVTLPGQALGGDVGDTALLRLLIEQGRLDDAAAVCPAGEIDLNDSFDLELVLLRARLWAARGEFVPARAELERAASWARSRGQVETADQLFYSDTLAVVLHRLGEAESARRTAGRLVDEARRLGAPGPLGRALCVAGTVAEDGDRLPLLEEAVSLLERSPRRLVLARALIELGAALRGAGRRVDARDPLRRAMELAHRCGAPGVEERAAEELRIAHGRVRQVARTGHDSLTASERRVALLAADGRSNREIAAELFLSVKTIEMHLNHVFRKLDVKSRRNLPEALAGV